MGAWKNGWQLAGFGMFAFAVVLSSMSAAGLIIGGNLDGNSLSYILGTYLVVFFEFFFSRASLFLIGVAFVLNVVGLWKLKKKAKK